MSDNVELFAFKTTIHYIVQLHESMIMMCAVLYKKHQHVYTFFTMVFGIKQVMDINIINNSQIHSCP